MLTARLSEIEKLLAKTQNVGTPVGRGPSFDFRSSDEFSALQEENRMVRHLRILLVLIRILIRDFCSFRKQSMSCTARSTNMRMR